MSTVGVFAGRGDVILAMFFAMLFGVWLGWQVRGLWVRLQSRRQAKSAE